MDGTFVFLGDEIQHRVLGILARQALREPSGLRPEMTLESLGIDSLGMAEVLFAIEEAFDLQVPFNANQPEAEGPALETVGAVCAAVEALVRAQRG